MTDTLIIINTAFQSCWETFKVLGMESDDGEPIKGMGEQTFNSLERYEKVIDVLFVDDSANLVDLDQFFKTITATDVYLCLHSGNEKKFRIKNIAERCLGNRLFNHIPEEHTGQGILFENLKKFTKTLRSNREEYLKELSELQELFESFDFELEAKLLLLHFLASKKSVDEIHNEKGISTALRLKISELLSEERITNILEDKADNLFLASRAVSEILFQEME